MKKTIIALAFILTASQASAQYSTGMVGNEPFMMNTFQNSMGSYSTGMVGNQSFGRVYPLTASKRSVMLSLNRKPSGDHDRIHLQRIPNRVPR